MLPNFEYFLLRKTFLINIDYIQKNFFTCLIQQVHRIGKIRQAIGD